MKSRPNRLCFFILSISLFIGGEGACALDRFNCLLELMPITEDTPLGRLRKGVEKPFLLNGGVQWIVFPDVVKFQVHGFFIYSTDGAVHFDSVEEDGQVVDLAALEIDGALLDLYAQPFGLTTVHIPYMAGLTGFHLAYRDPGELGEHDLSKWARAHSRPLVPAEDREFFLHHRILRLHTRVTLTEEALWAPLDHELTLRREWIQDHNLNQEDFKIFSKALRRSCHKP